MNDEELRECFEVWWEQEGESKAKMITLGRPDLAKEFLWSVWSDGAYIVQRKINEVAKKMYNLIWNVP